jgi:pilus assembly protein CpaD
MSSSKVLLATAAAAALLAACATPQTMRAEAPTLSTERFPTPVTLHSEPVLLAPHGQGLSSAQQAALYGELQRWRDANGGPILVETSSGGGAEATQATDRVAAFLRGYGVADADVRFTRYNGGADPRAPIRVTFPTYVVQIPDCDQSWHDLANAHRNDVHPEFGCSVTANIAAMVANPADLTFPRESTPIDATRAQNSLEKYRSGGLEKPSATAGAK